jgi:hypothetical protein
MRDRKRKFEAKRAYPQEKTMKLQQPTFSRQRSYNKVSYQAPTVSYRPYVTPTKTQKSFQEQHIRHRLIPLAISVASKRMR